MCARRDSCDGIEMHQPYFRSLSLSLCPDRELWPTDESFSQEGKLNPCIT